MKFTTPEFFKPFTQHVNRPVCPFTTLETTRELEPKLRPAIVSGIVTGDAPVSYWPIFSLSLVTVPKVFAKVKLAKFPFFLPIIPLYCGA